MYETEQDMPGERTHAAGVGRSVMILREEGGLLPRQALASASRCRLSAQQL